MQTQCYCYGCFLSKTDFPVVKVIFCSLLAAWIVCDIAIKRKYILPSFSSNMLPHLYYYTYPNRNNSWKPYCVVRFNMGWRVLVFYLERYGLHELFLKNISVTSRLQTTIKSRRLFWLISKCIHTNNAIPYRNYSFCSLPSMFLP